MIDGFISTNSVLEEPKTSLGSSGNNHYTTPARIIAQSCLNLKKRREVWAYLINKNPRYWTGLDVLKRIELYIVRHKQTYIEKPGLYI